MRTTLTIEDDIAVRIDEQRRRHGQTLKQVVNALLREGLRSAQRAPAARGYRTKPHALNLRPGYDAEKFNRLVDEFDD